MGQIIWLPAWNRNLRQGVWMTLTHKKRSGTSIVLGWEYDAVNQRCLPEKRWVSFSFPLNH